MDGPSVNQLVSPQCDRPVKPKQKRNRRKLVPIEVQKARKLEKDRQRSRETVHIGRQIERWNALRKELQIRHEVLAEILLDLYFKHAGPKTEIDDTRGQCESGQDNVHAQAETGYNAPESFNTDHLYVSWDNSNQGQTFFADLFNVSSGQDPDRKMHKLIVSQDGKNGKYFDEDDIDKGGIDVQEKDDDDLSVPSDEDIETDEFSEVAEESDDLYVPSDEDLETDDEEFSEGGNFYKPGDKEYQQGKRKCQKCDKFICKSGFRRHQKVHDKDRKMECKFCGSCFESVKEFNAHSHETVPKHECQFCGKFFKLYKKFNKHVKTCQETRENGEVKESCTCKFCGKKYLCESSCRKHEKIHKTGPFYCQYCKKEFEFKRVAKAHERTHAEAKKYICKYCGKKFAIKYCCQVHERSHTADKTKETQNRNSLLCHFCGKGFAASSMLQLHIRSHTGEKPYKCQTCFKSFSDNRRLKRHMLIHTGEKPYQCKFCEKRFVQQGACVSHMRIHTGEKPYKCHYCEKAFSHNVSRKAHEKAHEDM